MREDVHRDFLLSALRASSLRARLFAVEVDSVGMALKSGMVTVPEALRWIKDVGALESLGTIPEEVAGLDGKTNGQPARKGKRE